MRNKRMTFLSILLLVCSFSLHAGGQPENASWYLPDTGAMTNGSYYDLSVAPASGTTYKLMQVGSSIVRSGGNVVTITQADLPAGNNNDFTFINDNNATQTHPFTINYIITTYDRKWKPGWFEVIYYWVNSPGSMQDNLKSGTSITLDQAVNENILADGTSHFQLADFYLSFKAPAYGTLESGTYSAPLRISVYNSVSKTNTTDFPLEYYDLTLHAKYLASPEGQGEFTDFYFSVEPTNESYNVDLKGDAGKDIKIADLSFVHTEVSTSPKSYNQNPFQIAVTTTPLGWGNATSDDVMFKKVNIGTQALSSANSVGYTLTLKDTTSGVTANTVTTDDDGYSQKVNAHHVTENQQVGGNNNFNKFTFDGTLTIKITGDTTNLTAGRYSTTLYYYVIKN